ncbi:MAG: carbon monoxide dehydrogenase [Rhodospirillaceae bacterium]|nr:carbon monoxide dehydrogenase [Rhodospirillaceae bacterium]|tara:strand:+ start:43036 stop:43833 length:798 start_codon:yes stop_codon:yes gene_type:complete
MYEFTYSKASSVDDAVDQFGAAEDGKYMSGGMTLLPTLKQRLARPSDVIDLAQVPDMAGIEVSGGTVSIKAMTRHAVVAASEDVRGAIPALAKLAGGIGDPMVRNRGTIGGSIANNDPAADYPSSVVGLGATIQTNKREIAPDDFFLDLFETALEEGEIITKITYPVPDRAGYMKFPNPASRYCIVGVMVSQKGSDVRVGVTGAGACAFRVPEMEDALASSFTPDAVADIKIPDGDLNSDIHASSEYRAHLVTVMAKRAVAEAIA